MSIRRRKMGYFSDSDSDNEDKIISNNSGTNNSDNSEQSSLRFFENQTLLDLRTNVKFSRQKKGIKRLADSDSDSDVNVTMNHSIADDGINERVVTSTNNGTSDLIDTIVLVGLLLEQIKGYVDYSSVNNLLNVSKEYRVVKKVNYYWKLNKEYSLKYYNEDLFRWKMNNLLLTDTNRQLSLNLAAEIYRLDFSNSCHINTIRDVIFLLNIHSLDLSGCSKLVDVGPLRNGHSLNLSRCTSVIDVRALGNIYDLNLSDCRNLLDVQALGNVHTLNLSGCHLLTNVSALGRVHVLDLSFCHNLIDISALGRVRFLNLSGCHEVFDVSALSHVYSLNISYCDMSDISALGHVHSLDISNCCEITDVSALVHCHTVYLDSQQVGTLDTSALVECIIEEI